MSNQKIEQPSPASAVVAGYAILLAEILQEGRSGGWAEGSPLDEKVVALLSQNTVFVVTNRTSMILFRSRESADRFVGSFPVTVSGGMMVGEVPVFD